MVSGTDAKGDTIMLNWDADNNVVRPTEPNNAVTTWLYDQNTGYPLQITDAQNNAHGGASIGVSYQTFRNGHVADVNFGIDIMTHATVCSCRATLPR